VGANKTIAESCCLSGISGFDFYKEWSGVAGFGLACYNIIKK
jgi:hypothetical protein